MRSMEVSASLEGQIRSILNLPDQVADLQKRLAEVHSLLSMIQMALPPVLVTIDDACRILKISPASARRYVASGRLPSVRIGRSVRIDLSKIRLATPEEIARRAAAARGLR